MQLTLPLITLFVGTSLALPSLLQPRVASDWTLVNFTRACNADDTSCHYSYSVNPNDGTALTPCAYDVGASTVNNASTASYSLQCAAFAISSSWSGQFGAGKGFSTLSLQTGGYIAFPAYEDTALVNNTAVAPDRSFATQPLQQAKNVAK